LTITGGEKISTAVLTFAIKQAISSAVDIISTQVEAYAMNHAVPLVHRTPTDRLLHAREDHERCLRLAASYRARLARGETEMRELHMWALNHARMLRRRFAGALSTPQA
jgi:hypothetical protein